MLAMSAARATPCSSISAVQARASSAGSSGGSPQPVVSATCSAVLPHCPPSAAKKCREKKCTCASLPANSPQGVCIGLVPVCNPRRESELSESGDVVHAELLHHRLAVAAHRLQSQVEQHGDILAGLS